MTDTSLVDDAIEQLQAFGLKTYEAKCFVALSRVPQATAREISEITDVPRTRVYDAVGTLEDEGLVSIQHTNPQVFRAIELEEAIETLRRRYESRLQSVRESLDAIEPATVEGPEETATEVWTLSAGEAIAARTEQLLADADEEIWLLIDETVCDRELVDSIETAVNRGIQVHIAVIGTSPLTERLPDAITVDPSGGWLDTLGATATDGGIDHPTDRTVTRLLVVDQRKALVSAALTDVDAEVDEQSVYAAGETNGVVVMAHTLLASQLSDTTGS